MTTFDRLRPRGEVAGGAVRPLADSEGKRALFSSAGPDSARPAGGTVTVECARCGKRTELSPFAAARTMLPSFLLSVSIGRGDRESTVGLSRRQHGAFLRCPACGRGSWTRLTVHV